LTINNSLTGAGVSGATVTLTPVVPTTLAATNASGKTSATLPIGDYTLSIAATGYTTGTQEVELVAGIGEDLTIKLVPTANVIVAASASVTTAQAPGATVSLSGTATPMDNSTGATYTWTQVSGPTVTLTGANTATPSFTVPSTATMQTALLSALKPPGDTNPTARLEVLGINPHSIELATIVTLQVQVTTSSGSYTNTVSVTGTAPFQVTSGLRNVPLGIPQLLQGDPGVTWAWTVTSAPSGSSATIANPATQWPIFTPDVAGTYVLSEASGAGSLKLYAGTWVGAIGGIDPTDGLPVKPADPSCGACHDDVTAPDVWAEWRNTGHAVIVPENVDVAGGHWTFTGCGSCHSVGYNTTAANNGSDDVYQAIVAKNSTWTFPNGAPLAYENMFNNTTDANIPKLASLMNVQCENCHGPNSSAGHKTSDDTKTTFDATARVSLKAEVCGQCHGEPTRHGRFQQWQESAHANQSVAVGRAVDATTAIPAYPASDTTNCDAACQAIWSNTTNNGNNCARCHTGEGFVVWQDQSQTDARATNFNMLIQGASGNATYAEAVSMGLTKANVHSQTCATCHDPHDVGKTAQEQPFVDPTTGKLTDGTKNNTTKVRVTGDIAMLPAGFPAPGLGKGAICATCHNGRNGAHNDAVTTYGASGISTPHDSTTSEVLLGQNVYFVTNGQRGGHSFIANTCVNCHMELTPEPANYSFPGTGTNHSFKADMSICTNCHGAFDGGSIQAATKASLTDLTQFIGSGAAKAFNGMIFWARARRIPASATDTTAVYSHAASTGTDLSAYNVEVDLTTGVNSIASAILLEDSSNLQITLANPLQIQWTDGTAPVDVSTFIISLTNVRNDDTTNGTTAGTQPINTYPISLTGNLAKAIWNYITLNREGSFGIHNPGFTNTVIGATMAQDLTK
jgi:hypothetical protein